MLRFFSFVIVCCFNILYAPLFAQQAVGFTDALAQGKILVRVESKGGHSGRCIAVHFELLQDKPLEITIPAGHVFEPEDTTTQPIITIKEETFTLKAKNQFIRVQGLCAKSGNSSPGEKQAFRLGHLATGNLLKMAEYISKNKLWNEPATQYAIWAMTDSLNPAGIGHKGLTATACMLLGVPLPEYRVKYAPPPATPRPRPVVISPEPLAVEGDFQYQSNTTATVSIVVLNAAGENVRTVVEPRQHLPGWAKYSFYFKTTKLPKGNYDIVFMVDGQPNKKMRVRY